MNNPDENKDLDKIAVQSEIPDEADLEGTESLESLASPRFGGPDDQEVLDTVAPTNSLIDAKTLVHDDDQEVLDTVAPTNSFIDSKTFVQDNDPEVLDTVAPTNSFIDSQTLVHDNNSFVEEAQAEDDDDDVKSLPGGTDSRTFVDGEGCHLPTVGRMTKE